MQGRIVVTGGLGFIGSAVVRRLAGRGVPVTNLDKGTYAADARRLEGTGDLVETRAVDVAADPLGEHLA
ncbi:MAG TPA: NAD-dependent epimerase/dehydratase family protein, partial [Actinomycetota bacterium]|nr:NAD-dependent epimerase/dehydratase family protein [Actinomycetota bacterium]